MIRSEIEKNEVAVLIIDDSDFSRQAISEVLQNANITVVGEAKSAEDAYPMIHEGKANVFIIDVVMPKASGIELAKQLSELTFDYDIFIIMISSLEMDNIILESISYGAVDFLKKPFDKELLLNSIYKIQKQVQGKS
jgi:two-component system chemotaxis response regulator CheY